MSSFQQELDIYQDLWFIYVECILGNKLFIITSYIQCVEYTYIYKDITWCQKSYIWHTEWWRPMSIKASQFTDNWTIFYTMTRIITKKIKVLHFGPLGGDPPATSNEFPYQEVIIGYVAGSEIIVSTRKILQYVTNEQSTTQRNVHFGCWMNGSTSDLWWIAELWYSDEFKLELTPVWC